ncbi:MAG: ABC transporter permease [Chitinophagaceae bacterium]|nr:MAG: ABC transporter permease [Chitinophagaceae bacterium]
MPNKYSQSRALWAIIRASFKAIFAQPTSVVFSLLFPIIFILIFGAFGKEGVPVQRIALAPGSDTSNAVVDSLKSKSFIRFTYYSDTAAMRSDLLTGKLTSILHITPMGDSSAPRFMISVRSTSASGSTFYLFLQSLENIVLKAEAVTADQRRYIVKPELSEGQEYRQIDFVLPGQLGFSILFSTLFGISFTFFTLREQLVLKRFYASPVKRINILLGIGTSRLFFQLINVVVLILFGHFFLNFTLQHGAVTFLEMVALAIFMLFLLMGVGLIFASIAKTDTSIPLLINLFGFPQMLLSGTFFPISVFPKWMQDICFALPLTQFNNGMRKISFDGLHLWDCWEEIGILALWMALIYAVLSRVIRWK